MLTLALDSSGTACAAGLFGDGVALAEITENLPRGHAARLPILAAQVLSGQAPDLVAVTVGPGSFTGIRAALALAHGLAAGWSCPLVGVRVDEALIEQTGSAWITLHSRPGRIFLAYDGIFSACAIDDVPVPPPGTILAGNAAAPVAGSLRHRGAIVTVSPVFAPALHAIAAIAARRHAGLLPTLPAQPFYIDPPEARPAAPPP